MGKGILVFARRDDLYYHLNRYVREDQRFILVKPGNIFRQLGEGIFQIDPQEAGDYHRLFDELGERLDPVDEIIHLWNYESGSLDYLDHGDLERFNRAVQRNLTFGVRSIDLLTQAMASRSGLKKARITYCHYGLKTSLQPQNMMVPGWYFHLPEEQSQFSFTSIHLSQPFADPSQFAGLLLNELDRDHQNPWEEKRWRNAWRWSHPVKKNPRSAEGLSQGRRRIVLDRKYPQNRQRMGSLVWWSRWGGAFGENCQVPKFAKDRPVVGRRSSD